ncbi:MAG: ABC transporter permease [Lawsonibacter sp.]|jgi:putative ABC transport system permease protein
MLYILQTALELGFLYAPVALALFLSYRILDIADLTTDGAFTLGAAVSVVVCAAGHPILAIPLAMASTAVAGFVTALLQTKLGVPSILAGIITNTGLYTINLMTMGWTSNASLIKQRTIFHMFRDLGVGGSWYEIILAGVLTLAAALLLVAFLSTRLGLSIRATGDNRDMVRASSINPAFTITVGLCVANALTGLSGALVGQAQRSANVNIGTGMVVIGLACLIIGETVLGRGSMLRGALSVFVGSIIYRVIYAVALNSKVFPMEAMKLVTAIIVALAIAAPSIQKWVAFQRRKAASKVGKGDV